MKNSLEENVINNSKVNNSINKAVNNNNIFMSKDLNKQSLSNILSESNMELNLDEYKNKDFRCLTCYLIPFLTLNAPTNLIDINCNFGHTNKINLEEYLQSGYNNNFNNLSCSKCKAQFVKNEKIFMYCKECSEIVCDNCIIKHNNIFEDHHMINSEKYDTTCILHNETYDYFCLDCKKNICQYCSDDFHSEHNLVDLDDVIFKRKEIKNIKEKFMKERENYLNIPNIFNELVIKLKQDLDKIMINIKNQIKFKQSIINTYENKVDNYNAIINMKNLLFNINPFVIDKNITTIDNMINLMKYANMSDIHINNIKNNNLKKNVRSKIKNKKDKDKNIKNSNNNINIKNNNEVKKVKIETNDNAQKNNIIEGGDNQEKKIEENNNINIHKKFNTFNKKNVTFTQKKNENNSNNSKQIKEFNENSINNNKSMQIINKEIYEDKNVIDKSANKYKLPDIFERYKRIKRANLDNNINNKKEEDINKNNEEKIVRKLISRSTKNLGYVKTEPKELRSSNHNLQLKQKMQNDTDENKENKNSPQTQKIRNVNDKDKDPFTLIKKFNNNEISDNKEYEKRNLSHIKKEKQKENQKNQKEDQKEKEIKIKNEIKNINIRQNNKQLREKDKLMVSRDEDDEIDKEDEEDEEEEDEEEEEEEDEDVKK